MVLRFQEVMQTVAAAKAITARIYQGTAVAVWQYLAMPTVSKLSVRNSSIIGTMPPVMVAVYISMQVHRLLQIPLWQAIMQTTVVA
jgi:hypothetical protein